MSEALLPHTFWFRLALGCVRIDDIPGDDPARPLLNLPAQCRLPNVANLAGSPAWVDVSAAWNPRGLAFVFETNDQPGLGFKHNVKDPNDTDPARGHRVQLWVDTRDTRDVHRAGRFCHRFDVRLAGLEKSAANGTPSSKKNRAIHVDVERKPIARALAEPPPSPADAVLARAEAIKSNPDAGPGWRLELFLKAPALHGFDPESTRKLGFNCAVADPVRGELFLTVGRAFPIGEDPSLWSVLELRGNA